MWAIIAPLKIKESIWESIDDSKVFYDKKFLEENFAKPE